MIWLRLFIAAIALTISSDLSAWAQTQVNSPEGFYDCKGIANGATVRTDCGCGAPASSTYACRRCGDNISCLDCRGVPFGTTPNTDCGCGAPASSSYACRRCGDNTSCLGCDGVPFSGKVNTNCGCGNPAAGACGCNLNITCCRAAAGGNECINFGWFNDMRFNSTNAPIQGFYSHWGSSNNFVDPTGPWCVQGSTICGSMRCYESGGVQFNPAILGHQASFNNCPLSNHGCFDPASTILLEGGTLVEASDVKVGDRIFNSLSGRSFAVKRVLVGPENLPMVEMGFDGHLLRVTQEHPVLTSDGMRRASTVKVGDRIVDAAGKERVLEYVRLAEIVEGQRVVNFELDVDSSDPIDRLIIADNMISGDLVVQQSKLPGEE